MALAWPWLAGAGCAYGLCGLRQRRLLSGEMGLALAPPGPTFALAHPALPRAALQESPKAPAAGDDTGSGSGNSTDAAAT